MPESQKSDIVETKPHKTISPKECNQIIIQNLDKIIYELDLNLKDEYNRYTGACPVHGGDNKKAFTIYKDDARWFCWSRHCQDEIGSNMISLICSIKEWKYHQAIKWLSEMEYDPTIVIERPKEVEYKHSLTRQQVRKSLALSPPFYLKKGFSKELLDAYDIGYCSDPKSQMYGRVVFPIYNESGEYVGSTGRTIYPISNENPKWQHFQIKTSNYLYNLNNAYDHIKKHQSVVIVESCGNLLRLIQYGILNSVATFGAKLSRQQEIKLECTAAKKIILLFDPDEAGKKATGRTIQKYGRKYEIVAPNILSKDVCDSSEEEILKIKEYL